MSPAPGGPGAAEAPRTRGPRNAVVAVALLALVLVVVLTRLVGGGSEGSGSAGPGTSASSVPSASSSASKSPRSPATRAPSSAPTRDPETGLRVVALSSLPRQAQQTVALIERGGPFPYRQDGATFGNRERRLPSHPNGWYREYTVVTPGEDDRGPRRIVTGDDDRQVFYTADHYDSFVRVTR